VPILEEMPSLPRLKNLPSASRYLSLGMHEQWNKKIVFVDGRLSAVYPDMAYAYGVYSLQGQPSKDQIYIGWTIPVEASSERLGEFFL